MSWISYAQNAEDVRLRRAFLGQPTGFFIDVGANHPVDLSITKHFYDSGWRGINVEPHPDRFRQLQTERPRDINLNVGCSRQNGVLTLHAGRGAASGMSSFTDDEVALHRQRGVEFDALSVPVTTLAEICREHVQDRTIDFMSVDVEGHELEVLEGADFARYRPRVIVVEATRPNTTEPTHQRWEHLILNHDYLAAAFDGLNRYYVRREDEPLVPVIALAPNVFDDFVPYVYQRQIDHLTRRLAAYSRVDAVLRPVARAARAIGTLARRRGPERGGSP